jgi:hypothetical protein
MTGFTFRSVLGFFERAHPETAVERGREAYERNDYAAALKEWSAAAAIGDPDASYWLGLLYARGHGVVANLADAAAWYRRAAEQGHAMAQHQLSLLHLDGYRAQASSFARWYGAAAKREPEAADHNRRLLFPNGLDVPQDAAEALRLSRAAAEGGIADAQANSGLIYARGIGCERNYEEARRWYSLAAAQDSAAGELGLGILYANGHGVEEDLPTAAGWYQKAAEKGNAAAQVALGLMHLSGQGVDLDTDKAAEWSPKPPSRAMRGPSTIWRCSLWTATAGPATRAPPKPCCARPRGKISYRRCCGSPRCMRLEKPRCRT